MGWKRRIVLSFVPTFILFSLIALLPSRATAQMPVTNDPPFYGPFNVLLLQDGDGVKKPLVKEDSVLRADSPWAS